MSLKTVLLATALLAGIAGGEARANDTITIPMDHNGSRMEARLTNRMLSLVYAAPKASLATAGVKPGDELARLYWKDGAWQGEARVFKKDCRPATYAVNGAGNGKTLVLSAEVGPVWVPGSVEWDRCQWRTSPESKHLHLEFSATSATELARLDPTTDEAKAIVYANSLDRQQEAYRLKVKAEREAKEEAAREASIRAQQDALAERILSGAQPVAETVQAAPVASTPTVAETADDDMTPDQIEEAQAERALYSDPAFLASIGATGPLVSPEELAKDAEAAQAATVTAEPVPVQVEAVPEPSPSLDIDF